MADSTVKLVIDTDVKGGAFQEVGRGLKDIERETQTASTGIGIFDISLGNLVANGIQSAISGAAQLGSALFQVGVESRELASDSRETESLLNSALGPAYEGFAQQVDAVSDATGRSGREFKQAIAPILAMTKAQGFANEIAGETSVAFGEAALDLNSYFNSTTGFEDLQSALGGSSETLLKYGINAKEGALQQEALRLGLIDTLEPLDAMARTTALLSLVQSQASDAMGDATRTAGESANVQRALIDLAGDYKAALGEVVLEGIAPMQAGILELGKTSLPLFEARMGAAAEGTAEFALGMGVLIQNVNLSEGDAFGAGIIRLVDHLTGVSRTAEFIGEKIDKVKKLGEAANIIAVNAEEAAAALEKVDSKLANTKTPEFDPKPPVYYTERLDVMGDIAAQLALQLGDTKFDVDALNASFGMMESATYPIAQTTASLAYELGAMDAYFTADSIDALNDSLGGATSTAEESVRSFGRASTSISDMQRAANEFTTGSLISTDADADKGVADYIADYAEKMNLPVDQTIAILEAQGLSQEEINAKTTELLEKASALEIVNQLSSGGLGAEGLAGAIDSASTGIASLESPIDAVKNSALELGDVFSGLDGEFFTTLNVSIPGLDEVRELAGLVGAITGTELPDVPGVPSGGGNEFTGDSIAANAGRTR